MPVQPTIIAGSVAGISANAASVTVPNSGANITAGKRRWLVIDVANVAVNNEGSLTGWKLVTASGGVALASTRRGHIYTCIADGTESTSFTWSAANNYGAVWWQTDSDYFEDPVHIDPPTPTGNTASQTALSSPAITTTLDKSLLIVVYMVFVTTASVSISTPTGMTILGGQSGNGSAGHTIQLFYQELATATAAGAKSSTSGTSGAWASMAFAIGPGLDPGQFLPFFH